jgi:plastocyanin
VNRAAALALALAATVLATTHARGDGGTLRGTVQVRRPGGVPSGLVLVYVVGFTEKAPAAPVEVKQVKKQFVPDLIAVTAGGTVAFPNGDPFLHNVFSPTTERSFDLGSYKQGESRSRTFPRTGAIDIYCNLHPEMSATLVILPNTRYAIADASGRFEIANVPPGQWSVFAYSRRAPQPVSSKIAIQSGVTTEVVLQLDEVQRDFAHRNKYGETYRDTTVYPPGT